MIARRALIATLPAIALAGLLAGHRLTYAALASADHGLAADAHGYLGPAGVTAIALAVMAALFCFAMGSMQNKHAKPRSLQLLATLSAIQVVGFGLQEVLERVVVGAPMTGLAAIFLLGIPVQLIVAAAATLLAIGLYKAGDALVRLLSPSTTGRPTSPRRAFPTHTRGRAAYLSGGRWTRGPPNLFGASLVR